MNLSTIEQIIYYAEKVTGLKVGQYNINYWNSLCRCQAQIVLDKWKELYRKMQEIKNEQV